MTNNRIVLTAGALTGALAAGGIIGALFFGPLAATAATSPSPSGATTPAPGATPKSNEDGAHEQGETPEQEAAENNGSARHGGPGGRAGGMNGHSNEDPAHEQGESSDREKAEDGTAPAASPSPAAQ